MSRNTNQFVTLSRIGPAKAPREARVTGFGEIYAPFVPAAGPGCERGRRMRNSGRCFTSS